MLRLMLKDIQISKRYLLLGIAAMGLAIYVICVALEGFPLAFPVAFFSYLLIITASKADEKNNNGRMLASLPIRRQDIVNSKYLGIFMFFVYAFLVALACRTVAVIIFPDEN